ncbi:MAG: hypothetical protein GY804_09320 [Alphaproteobacteria bacterium]|nr:hypothetical protein [Alphaproteobacteria bacterium]
MTLQHMALYQKTDPFKVALKELDEYIVFSSSNIHTQGKVGDVIIEIGKRIREIFKPIYKKLAININIKETELQHFKKTNKELIGHITAVQNKFSTYQIHYPTGMKGSYDKCISDLTLCYNTIDIHKVGNNTLNFLNRVFVDMKGGIDCNIDPTKSGNLKKRSKQASRLVKDNFSQESTNMGLYKKLYPKENSLSDNIMSLRNLEKELIQVVEVRKLSQSCEKIVDQIINHITTHQNDNIIDRADILILAKVVRNIAELFSHFAVATQVQNVLEHNTVVNLRLLATYL